MKKCGTCLLEKPLEEFNKKANGLSQYHCRECSKAKKKQWYQDNLERERNKIKERKAREMEKKKDYVWTFLSSNPCVDCGEADPIVLEFDHVRGNKNGHVGRMIHDGFSLQTIVDEIDKCEVRCANCHVRKTTKQFDWWKGKR